jgi:hypothetical protein
MKRLLLIAIAVLIAAAPEAHARVAQQKVNLVKAAEKVSIEQGTVYVNGKEVADRDLPSGLRDLSSDVNMTFWTMDNSLIEINGSMFVFEEGTFRDAAPGEKSNRNVMVTFSSDNSGGADVRLYEAPEASFGYVVRTGDADGHVMKDYVAQLRERAEEFNKLTFELKEVSPQSSQLARQMVVEAENTARLASIFPRVEYEAYMGSMQNQNRRLYEELVRERDMEMRTHQLAQAIQAATTEEAREQHQAELRDILTEIFELKQANRQKEIEQLEQQLKELQSRLEDREALKEDIIESRLNDLLNLHRW